MACISMGLHPNHVIYGLFCRQEAGLQIMSTLLSIIITYTCAVLNAMKNNKTLQRFCGSLYMPRLRDTLLHEIHAEQSKGPKHLKGFQGHCTQGGQEQWSVHTAQTQNNIVLLWLEPPLANDFCNFLNKIAKIMNIFVDVDL